MEVVNFRNIAYVSLSIIVMLLILVAYIVIGIMSKNMPGDVGFVFGVIVSIFTYLVIYIHIGIFRIAEIDREDALEEAIRFAELDRDEEEFEEFVE